MPVKRSADMPRYYLNLFNDVDTMDESGEDYTDLAAAKENAIASARELMAEHLLAGLPIRLWHRIEIADETGKVLATLPFRELVTIVHEPPR